MSARVSALVRALLAVMVVGSEAGAGEVRLCRRATLLSCTAAALPWTRQGLAAPPLTPPSLRQVVERTLSASDQERLPVRLVQQLFQGLDAPDIFYPDWFGRKWRATSTLLQVLAPAGPELFTPGRNGSLALANARAGIGEALQYDVRWIKTSGQWIVDREFNLASITRASMGGRAVQDIQADSPDRCHLYIRPSAAPGSAVYRAELRVIARCVSMLSAAAVQRMHTVAGASWGPGAHARGGPCAAHFLIAPFVRACSIF